MARREHTQSNDSWRCGTPRVPELGRDRSGTKSCAGGSHTAKLGGGRGWRWLMALVAYSSESEAEEGEGAPVKRARESRDGADLPSPKRQKRAEEDSDGAQPALAPQEEEEEHRQGSKQKRRKKKGGGRKRRKKKKGLPPPGQLLSSANVPEFLQGALATVRALSRSLSLSPCADPARKVKDIAVEQHIAPALATAEQDATVQRMVSRVTAAASARAHGCCPPGPSWRSAKQRWRASERTTRLQSASTKTAERGAGGRPRPTASAGDTR